MIQTQVQPAPRGLEAYQKGDLRLSETAIAYLQAGLCVLPAIGAEKRPALAGWKQYQQRLPTERQVRTWFAQSPATCLLTGVVSGHLEMIDFDAEAELYDRWIELVAGEMPDLLQRLVIERSQSGGRHVVYRCQEPIPGNRKLALRTIVVESGEPVMLAGKRYVPRKVDQRFEVTMTLIETRGEGGLFLCDPSPDYCLQQGSFASLPVLSAAERSVLIEAACALTEIEPPPSRVLAALSGEGRPGDDFNQRGDLRQLLEQHGWQRVRGGENEYWRRPGKEHGWSASLRDNQLYVFSSNAAPFEPDRAYGAFSVYAQLEHGGDFAAAATELRLQGYGQAADNSDVDLSRLIPISIAATREPSSDYCDPGPLPPELLRIPGFVSEVMDHCLETAPYPNPALAFCGALSLQAVLAGRKVRDPADNRTNIYLLALAYSSVGKDWPRKINTHIMHRVGMVSALGEKFASGEGIQDSLFLTPSMLLLAEHLSAEYRVKTEGRGRTVDEWKQRPERGDNHWFDR